MLNHDFHKCQKSKNSTPTPRKHHSRSRKSPKRIAIHERNNISHGAKHSPSSPGGDFPLRVLTETFIFWVPLWVCFSSFSWPWWSRIPEFNKKSNSFMWKSYRMQSPVSIWWDFPVNTAASRFLSGFVTWSKVVRKRVGDHVNRCQWLISINFNYF